MLNLLDKQMKLKLSTGSEALTLSGLRYSIPRFFHNHFLWRALKGVKGDLFSPTYYDTWSNPNLAMKQWLIQRMNVVWTCNIFFDTGLVAYEVVVDALSQSVVLICHFISFMAWPWEQLHILSGFSEERAWELVTQLVAQVLTSMGAKRDEVCS